MPEESAARDVMPTKLQESARHGLGPALPQVSPPQRIADLPQDDRPREKLLRQGPASLSDAELLAIFFRTGIKGMNAIEMGRQLLSRYGNKLSQLSRLSVSELLDLKGLGEAKAIHLVATFELGKRLAREEHSDATFNQPAAVLDLLAAEMRAEAQEVLKVVLLDARMKLLGVEEITRGTINETVAHPRDVLHHVIRRRAHAFVIVHNHPAGNPDPSAADRNFTRRLRESSETMQVQLMDHIIIGLPSSGHRGYFSFRENGML
jgi:DNA repair protein RadC